MTWKLLRVFFKERFGFHRIFGQRIASSFWKKAGMTLLLVYAFGATSFSIGFLNATIVENLPLQEQGPFLLQQVFAYVLGIGFLFSFFQARGSLYAFKDFDILGALPLSSQTVIRAKFLMMYVFIFGFSLLLTAPILFLYVGFVQPSWLGILFGLLTFLFLPLPAIAFGAILSMGIYQLTVKWVNPKLVQTILMMLFLIGYVGFSLFSLSETNQTPDWISTLFAWYVPSQWFIESFSGNVYSFFLLMGSHGFVLGVFVLGLHRWMHRLNQSQHVNRFVSNEKIPVKNKLVLVHLIANEWKRFVHSPIYILNTGFGLLLFVLGAFALLFFPNLLIAIEPLFSLDESAHVIAMLTFAGFVLSTLYTPAISLSLEGKNINLLKHLPIHPMTISLAKITFNVGVGFFPLVLGWVALSFTFSLTWSFSFMTLLVMMSMLIFMSIMFYWINLLFPRFDFQQDVEIVKQSVAALVAVFGGFGVVASIVFFLVTDLISLGFMFRLILVVAFLWVLSVGLITLLSKKIEPIFKRFSV